MKELLEQAHALSMQLEEIMSDLSQIDTDCVTDDLRHQVETLTGDIQTVINDL